MKSDILRRLWTMYGSKEFPAEWDGNVFGGGKLSQRFWEYFIAVEMLDLKPDSVVLDIGGGKGFFAKLIAPFVQNVIILDRDQDSSTAKISNVECVTKNAEGDVLSSILQQTITHISCLSVFEHIPEDVRIKIIQDIDAAFRGHAFVSTFEFHPLITYFEHQLTIRTMSNLFSGFKHFYPVRIEASPMRSENSFGKASTPFNSRKKQFIGMWYPLAIKFTKVA